MIKIREFLDLTDQEIEFILKDIFHCIKVENIQRDKKHNEITADMTTIWCDEDKNLEITDLVTLTQNEINIDFPFTIQHKLKWNQFLVSKGCHKLFHKNPYIKDNVD